MRMPFRALLAVAFLAACTRSAGTAVAPPPTRTAAPTSTAAPAAPTEMPAATAPSPSETPAATETAAPAPSAVPTETAVPADVEAILILGPGLGDSVGSPVHVSGQADPTFEQSLVVQVTNADGVILAVTPAQIAADVGQRGPFEADLAFSVEASQPGRITVYAASPRDGGLTHLASVEVTLLAPGQPAALSAAAPRGETIRIDAPVFLEEASGGALRVAGFSDYFFEAALGVAVCGQGGSGAPEPLCGAEDNRLGYGAAMIQAPDMGQPGPFEATIPYVTADTVRGRVVVYAVSPRDGGLTHLSSREVVLAP